MRFDPGLNGHMIEIPLPPGSYRYRLIVNGQWITDPHNPLTEPNPYGGSDSVMIGPARAMPTMSVEAKPGPAAPVSVETPAMTDHETKARQAARDLLTEGSD